MYLELHQESTTSAFHLFIYSLSLVSWKLAPPMMRRMMSDILIKEHRREKKNNTSGENKSHHKI